MIPRMTGKCFLWVCCQVKEPVLFDQWLKRLRHHRLYRQHELIYGAKNDIPRLSDVTSPVEERPALASKLPPLIRGF